MKEIIHIQAGSLSNYTGTHFWNTQENYFVYDGDGISMTDYSISFKEGRDEHVRPVYLRRPVLVVYHLRLIRRTSLPCAQDSLLSIRNVRAFYGKVIQALLTYCGFVKQISAHLQGIRVKKRLCHGRQLGEFAESRGMTTCSSRRDRHGGLMRQEQERIPRSEYHSRLHLEDDSEQAEPVTTKIRYWSDFSRVFFDPKSIQAVPDTPELVEGDWNASCETFSRYDDVRVRLHRIPPN